MRTGPHSCRAFRTRPYRNEGFGTSHVSIPLNRKGPAIFGSSQPRGYRLRCRHLDPGGLRPVAPEVTVSVNAAIAAAALAETE